MSDPLRDTLQIRFGRAELEHLSCGLSDLSCWLRGYRSARPEDEYGPMGVSVLIDLNILFKTAMHAHDRQKQPPEETTP